MQVEQMRLDGNAAGGMLRELFARDVTAALATCGGCGKVGPVGALLEYGHGMGVVLRCPSCDTALMKIVTDAGRAWIDFRGLGALELSR